MNAIQALLTQKKISDDATVFTSAAGGKYDGMV